MAGCNEKELKSLETDSDEDEKSERFPSTLMDESLMVGNGPLPFSYIYDGFLSNKINPSKGRE